MRNGISFFLFPILFAANAYAAEFFVDAQNGLDSNQGTLAAPFKTIARASSQLKPGDVCILRGGTYRETLTPVTSGEEGAPIVYRSAPNEKVILSGLEPVNGWRPDKDGVYQAKVPKDARGEFVFAGGQCATEARWPKATGSFLVSPRASVVAVHKSDAQKKGMDEIVDPNLPNFTAEGLKGARIWYLNWFTGWWADMDRVVNFDPVKKAVTLAKVIEYSERERRLGLPFTYVLIGKRQLLTAENEWAYEPSNKTLYYKAPGGRNPSGDSVEISVRSTAIDLKGKHHIEVDGLELRAASIITDEQTSHCRLQRLKIIYAHSKFGGNNNELRDSELACSQNRSILFISGSRNRIVNNWFHDVSEQGCATAVQIRGGEQLFAYNTMDRGGDRFIGVDAERCQILHNSFRDCSLLARDSASIHTGGDGGGTEIAYNLCLTDYRKLHYVNGIYLDNLASHYILHHNVVPVIALNAPKNNCLVCNNTIYRFSDYNPHGDDELPVNTIRNSLPYGDLQDYAGTMFVNNLFAFEAHPFSGLTYAGNLSSLDPEKIFNDRSGKKLEALEEPWKYDFTLKPGSPAIGGGFPVPGITSGFPDKPADIGAYEFGQPLWEAGCDLASPRNVEYVRPDFPFMNLLVNQGFEVPDTLEPWIKTGTRTARHFASAKLGWGLKDGDEARFKGAAQLGEGANGLEQTVDHLQPGAKYIYWAWVKPSAPGQIVQIGVRDGIGVEPTSTMWHATGWVRMFVRFSPPAGMHKATVFVKKLSSDAAVITFDQTSLTREWEAAPENIPPVPNARFQPLEDTYVSLSQPDRVFGYNESAALRNSPGPRQDIRRPFFKFDLSSLKQQNFNKATLKFYTSISSKAKMPAISVVEVLSDNWAARGEKPITWNTQPPTGKVIATIHPGQAGWVEVDLTAYLQNRLKASRTVSLSLNDPDASGTYVGVPTTQMMMCPPVSTYPPVIEVIK